MRITSVHANNRKRVFEVHTREQDFTFPYSKTDPAPSSDDPIIGLFVDPELGYEGFTYQLASGSEGSIHLDAVLDYNEDPTYMVEMALYELTLEARSRYERSQLSAREVAAGWLGTSPAQVYRLLDPTNYGKSVPQLLSLLHVLGAEVQFEVKDRSRSGAEQRPSRSERGAEPAVRPGKPNTAAHSESAAESVRRTSVSPGMIHNDLIPPRLGDQLAIPRLAGLRGQLATLLDGNDFSPTEAHVLQVPKKSDGLRPAAVLPFADRLFYSALVRSCSKELEHYLPRRNIVVWPRAYEATRAWGRFEALTFKSKEQYLVRADVSGFYESVRHSALRDRLYEAGCAESTVTSLLEWLKAAMGTDVGLPQGLSASDHLATIYLRPVDEALTKAGYRHVRYVDDYRIFIRSLNEALEAEELLRSALSGVGLVANNDKTKTLRRDTYEQHRREVDLASDGLRSDIVVGVDELDVPNDKVIQLLDSFHLSESLQWSWYHGNLGPEELMQELEQRLLPGDEDAALSLLEAVIAQQGSMARLEAWVGRRHREPGKMTDTVAIAGLAMLMAREAAQAIPIVKELSAARPQYTSFVSVYLKAVTRQSPRSAGEIMIQLQQSGATRDAQWAEYYAAIAAAPPNEAGLGDLAILHISDRSRNWLTPIEAAKYLVRHKSLPKPLAYDIWQSSPDALRDDAVAIVVAADPDNRDSLLNSELRPMTREVVEFAA